MVKLKTNIAFVSTTVHNETVSKYQETRIAADGLHYKRKEGGSLFKDSSNGMTISCYKCGLHKPRSMGTFRMLINQRMFMCGECMLPKSVYGSASFFRQFFLQYLQRCN